MNDIMYHVRVGIREFGTFRDTAPRESSIRYLHDVRTGLEQNGMGWAMWDWSGNFGLSERKDGVVTPDSDNVKTLGFRRFLRVQVAGTFIKITWARRKLAFKEVDQTRPQSTLG